MWATADGPVVRPVEARCDTRVTAVLIDPDDGLREGQEIVVLVDDGVWWFDLRAVFTRATVWPSRAAEAAPDGRLWAPLEPVATVAWDYGQLREVDDAPR